MTQAHLTDITSIGEQKFVVKLLTKSGGGDAWFGLTLLDSLSWSDGTPLSHASWCKVKTVNSTICYRLQYQDNEEFSWNNEWGCENGIAFICKNKGI